MHALSSKTWVTFSVLVLLLHYKTVSHWHDHYRMLQVMLISTAACWLLFQRKIWVIDQPTVRVLVTVLAISGVVSIGQSAQPWWALAEVALLIGSFGLWNALVLYTRSSGHARYAHATLHAAVWGLAALWLLQAAWVYGTGLQQQAMNTHALAATFDNPRFLGQVITLFLPIMGAHILHMAASGRQTPAFVFAKLIFAGTWCLVIATGTRGTWLAVAMVAAIASLTGPVARRWVLRQCMGAAAGTVLTVLLLYLIPQWLEVAITNGPSERLHLGLSTREIIWGQAWQMIQTAPWLGHGPMHFAQLHSVAGAHPHQLLLQFAAEWGLVATVCLCALTGWALVAMLRRMVQWQKQRHAHAALYIGLSTAVAASLVQSMVDGVWVMPYTQTALTTVAAFAFALHHQERWEQHPPSIELTLWDKGYTVALLLACAVLLYSLWPGSATSLHQSLTAFELPDQFKPRYWVQGFI